MPKRWASRPEPFPTTPTGDLKRHKSGTTFRPTGPLSVTSAASVPGKYVERLLISVDPGRFGACVQICDLGGKVRVFLHHLGQLRRCE